MVGSGVTVETVARFLAAADGVIAGHRLEAGTAYRGSRFDPWDPGDRGAGGGRPVSLTSS